MNDFSQKGFNFCQDIDAFSYFVLYRFEAPKCFPVHNIPAAL